MPTTELDKTELPALTALRGVIRTVRDEADAEMPAQTLMALLEVANDPGLTMKELEARLGLTTASVSRLVSRLSEWKSEKIGAKEPGLNFLTRRSNPNDRRYQIVNLTPKGLSFVRKLTRALTPKH